MKKSLVFLMIFILATLLITATSCGECNHKFSTWETVQKVSCDQAGEEKSLCDKCGAESTRTIEALGEHNFSNWETVIEPSYAKRGLNQKTCLVCDSAQTESIPALCETTNVKEASSFADIDLSSCKIIYGNLDDNSLVVERAKKLASAINQNTGKLVALEKRNIVKAGDTSFEILIGETKYTESIEALAAIEGSGFVVRVVGNKLVIVGSDDCQTASGIQYFINKYLSYKTESTLRVCTEATLYNTNVYTVADDSGFKYELVFDKDLDNDISHAYTTSTGDYHLDYPCKLAKTLASELVSILKLNDSSVVYRNNETSSNYELLIGPIDDATAESFLASLDGNEYGILVKENKIILTAHNDYALGVCVQRFKKVLDACKTVTAGKTVYQIPEGFYLIETANKNWIVDFPRPVAKGISLHSSINAANDALQFLYMGDGVNADAYKKYCAQLLASGYTVFSENEVEGSLFTTFVGNDMMLYVAYNAYSHADEAHNTDDSTHVTKYKYLDYDPCIRIVSSPLATAYLPEESLLSLQSYEKVTESAITAVGLQTGTIGTCYIITLEDGSFVVVDGGYTLKGALKIWEVLSGLHEKIYNEKPSASSPVRVKAWYVTHSHNDHYESFKFLMDTHKKANDISVEYIIGNFPEASAAYNSGGDAIWLGENTSYVTNTLGMKYVKLYTGQTIYLANLKIDTLMTFLDHAPHRIDNANDTNAITRFTFTNSPQNTNLLMLGDACVYQSRYLCAMYGDYLKSDMVEFAHHGNIGCEIALYKLAAPTVIWYPNNSAGFSNYYNPSKTSWPQNVTNYIMTSLDSLQYLYISGIDNIPSTNALSLQFKSDGTLDFDVFNPLTGEKFTYQTSGVRMKTTPAYKLK